ncbi:MAG: phosphonate ABC transporter ATP-binding protein [Asticcacaulis sp.]
MAPSVELPLVDVKTISKTYHRKGDKAGAGHKALKDVSFVMDRPERIALIGPSGSGKSTLLRSISGLILTDKTEGCVTVLGRTVQSGGRLGPQVRLARSTMGMIAQQFNLVGRLSLFTNVALGLLGKISPVRGLFGLWHADEKQKIMRALHHVGVAPMAAQRANTLSGGQQQRGAIARAIVQDAQLVLADEPVASLDPVTARKVMKLLVELNERNHVGVIVTLHQVDYAKTYCTRILALKDGQIVYDGPSTGLSDDLLREIYGAEIEDAYWGDTHEA